MTRHKQAIRFQFAADSRPPNIGADRSTFQILFIQAAQANGWTFSQAVLEESAALWNECSVFVDHAMWGRSVRDLGGVLSNAAWSDEHNGLTAMLTPAGPSKEIVFEAARVMMSDGAHPDIGFSADLLFTADAQNNVQKIMQPLSVDLVVDPAFATKFIRQLNAKGVQPVALKGHDMPEPLSTPVPEKKEEHNIPANAGSVADAFQIAMGDQLLETALQNASLPEPASKALRTQFHGKPYKPAELTEAITAWKESIAAVTAADEIVGPARFSSMFNSTDQLQAAIDDLIGAPREKGAENLKVAQFSGVKEAYMGLTGDREFVGGLLQGPCSISEQQRHVPRAAGQRLE